MHQVRLFFLPQIKNKKTSKKCYLKGWAFLRLRKENHLFYQRIYLKILYHLLSNIDQRVNLLVIYKFSGVTSKSLGTSIFKISRFLGIYIDVNWVILVSLPCYNSYNCYSSQIKYKWDIPFLYET